MPAGSVKDIIRSVSQLLGIFLVLSVVLGMSHVQAGDIASGRLDSQAMSTPITTSVTYAVINVGPHDVLNIRARPGIASPVIGRIPAFGGDIHRREAGEDARTSAWMPIRYKGQAGWVSSSYLARQLGSMNKVVSARAGQIFWALKHKDLKSLSRYAHPDKGVRFSPYAYVRNEDLVFRAADMSNLMFNQTVYNWGYFDGTGQPITLTFNAFFTRFIHNAQLSRPQQVGCNTVIGKGNTINNIKSFYPNAIFIEYYFVGKDVQQSGMDWRSLRLVLEEQKGAWYLVGVINDEWTI
jgi:hypothetical protein